MCLANSNWMLFVMKDLIISKVIEPVEELVAGYSVSIDGTDYIPLDVFSEVYAASAELFVDGFHFLNRVVDCYVFGLFISIAGAIVLYKALCWRRKVKMSSPAKADEK